MPTLELTTEQVIELAKQLRSQDQEQLLRALLACHWPRWEELTKLGQERMRTVAAQRGRNWDAMTDDEREAFVDDLVHEDR